MQRKNKGDRNSGRGNPDQEELAEMLAQKQHQEMLDRVAAEGNDQEQESGQEVSSADIKETVADRQEQVDLQTGAVLGLEPHPESAANNDPELADNTNAVVGLGHDTNQQLETSLNIPIETEEPAPVIESTPQGKKDGRTKKQIISDNEKRLPEALDALERKQAETLDKKLEEEAASTSRLIEQVEQAFPETISEAPTPANENPVNTEATPKKRSISLQEWENNRLNFQRTLEAQADVDFNEDPINYGKWYNGKVVPKLDDWERRNPKPKESTTTGMTDADFESMMKQESEAPAASTAPEALPIVEPTVVTEIEDTETAPPVDDLEEILRTLDRSGRKNPAVPEALPIVEPQAETPSAEAAPAPEVPPVVPSTETAKPKTELTAPLSEEPTVETPPTATPEAAPTPETTQATPTAEAESDNLGRLFEEFENMQAGSLPEQAPELITEIDVEEPEPVDRAYHEFTRREGILSGFISRKVELLNDKLDRFGNAPWKREEGYSLFSRSVARLKNFFDGKLFNRRNAKTMKMEEKIGLIDQDIATQEETVRMYQEIINDKGAPVKERIKAQKIVMAAQKKLVALRHGKSASVTKLQKFETLKEECHNRIAERSNAIADSINERIEPYKDKLEEGELVLTTLRQEMTDTSQELVDWNGKLMEAKEMYKGAKGADRAKIKQQIKRMKTAIRERQKILKSTDQKLKVCNSKLDHLQNKINPWTDLAKTYEQLADLPVYWSDEEKDEYVPHQTSDSARPRSARRTETGTGAGDFEIMEDDEELNVMDYFKEFNNYRGLRPGHELGIENEADFNRMMSKIEDFNASNNEAKIKSIEKGMTEYFIEQGEDPRLVKDILDMVRLALSRKKASN